MAKTESITIMKDLYTARFCQSLSIIGYLVRRETLHFVPYLTAFHIRRPRTTTREKAPIATLTSIFAKPVSNSTIRYRTSNNEAALDIRWIYLFH
jgi:hypothetical protein